MATTLLMRCYRLTTSVSCNVQSRHKKQVTHCTVTGLRYLSNQHNDTVNNTKRIQHHRTTNTHHNKWQPIKSTTTSNCTWNDLKIQSNIYNYLVNKLNLHKPTLIQQAAIPHLTRRPFTATHYNDIIIHDITGQGKTLSYILPIISNIDVYMNAVQCIVVTPTRELAQQIYNVINELATNSNSKRKLHNSTHTTHLRTQLCVGTVNPTMLAQMGVIDQFNDTLYASDQYEQIAANEQNIRMADKHKNKDIVRFDTEADIVYAPHIIVGTADTTHDLLIQKAVFELRSIKYIVCDEIDAILNNANTGKHTIDALLHIQQFTFNKNTDATTDIDTTHKTVTKKSKLEPLEHERDYGRAQIVLVSATITEQVKHLADKHLHNDMKYINVDTVSDNITNKHKQRSADILVPQHIKHYFIVTNNKQLTLNSLTSWITNDFNTYVQQQQYANNTTNKQRTASNATTHSVIVGGSNPYIDTTKQTTAVFFNAKHSITQDITDTLTERNNTVAMLNDSSSRSERRDALKLNKANVILATDLLSRGLDIKTLTHIINYEVPNTVTQYIHRCGRVGRLGMVHSKCAIVINIIDEQQQTTQLPRLHKYMSDIGLHGKLQQLIIYNGTLHRQHNKQLHSVRLAPKIVQPNNSMSNVKQVASKQMDNKTVKKLHYA